MSWACPPVSAIPRMNNYQPKKRRSICASFRDAFRGIWDCLKYERNMRIHLVACAYVLFFAFRLSLERGEMAALVLAIGLVMAAEAMNTSVEKLCDFAQRHQNPMIRLVKDVAAGAVMLSAVAAAVVGVTVMFRPELWEAVVLLCSHPGSLMLLVISAVLAMVFVFIGPQRIIEVFGKAVNKDNKQNKAGPGLK